MADQIEPAFDPFAVDRAFIPFCRSTPCAAPWAFGDVQSNEKRAKRIYTPDGRIAKSNDPKTWVTLTEALQAVADGKGVERDGLLVPFAGVALVHPAQVGLAVVDLDNAVADGEPIPWATALIEEFDSYTELSVSRTGLHVVVGAESAEFKKLRSDLVVDGRRVVVELFRWTGYVCVTGLVLG